MSHLQNTDLLALRSYITAQDTTQHSNLAPTTLILDITHSNLIQRHIELRFDKHDTISDLRYRIHRQTGTKPHYQRLQVRDCGTVLLEIPPEHENDRKLGYFGFEHGFEIHCIDLDPYSGSKGGWFEDTRLVKKYEMSEKEYDERKGTLREWGRSMKEKDENFSWARHAKEHREMMEMKRRLKMGEDLPEGFEVDEKGEVVRKKEDQKEVSIPGPESVVGINIGMRCEVSPGGRRGVVKFVGEVKVIGGGGYWVGVLFDEPVGKADGTINGKIYFEANPGYAGFVRGKNIHVGDFPERDVLDELQSDSEDEL